MATQALTMDDLLAGDGVKQLVTGEVVTGRVLSVRKRDVLIDLGPQGVGYVPRREIGAAKALAVGDEVTASVVDSELENGYSLLSLRKVVCIQCSFDVQNELWQRTRTESGLHSQNTLNSHCQHG